MNGVAVILACLGTINTNTVELDVWSGHEWMSQCHMASTVRSFDYPQQQCFCIERSDDNVHRPDISRQAQ